MSRASAPDLDQVYRNAMLEKLASTDVTVVAKELNSFCHDGLELRVQDGWVASICSEEAYGPGPETAVFKLRDLVVERIKGGSMGC